MSSLSGERGGGLDPKFYMPLLAVAVGLLLVSAFSIGAVAVLLLNGGSANSQQEVYGTSTTSTTSSTLTSITTTKTTTVGPSYGTKSTTTLQEGPTTTFLEYFATTTTLSEVQLPEEENSCSSTGYRGPFACKAKNLAWFDQWA